MNRYVVALVLNLALAISVWAQQSNPIPTVGVLMVAAKADDPIVEAFRQGLRELGYVEGQNIKIEVRTANGRYGDLPKLAEDLIRSKADVVVVGSEVSIRALVRASPSVQIVSATADLAASGLVGNLAHPSGNLTGFSSMSKDLNAKRLQLLKEAIPNLSHVGVLWNPEMRANAGMVEELKAVAPELSIKLHFISVRTANEVVPAFSTFRRDGAQAILVLESPLTYSQRKMLAELTHKARLPAIFGTKLYAEEGGLMSFGVNYTEQWRRSASYVVKILQGTKPSDLPIEQPTRFELVVNLKTAKALGITIPESILLRADEVIR